MRGLENFRPEFNILFEGEYVCFAENVAGKEEISFFIDVWKSPDFEEDEKVVNQTKGKRLELHCDVEAHPVPEISWFKNGHALSLMSGIRLADNRATLIIESVGLSDIGHYECLAVNKAGENRKSFQGTFKFLIFRI